MKTILTTICLSLTLIVKAFAQQPVLQEGLALKYLVQLPSEKSAYMPVIILLHGYGADERDLFELRTAFPKNYLIVAARAPYPLPGGGYQWYESATVNGKHDGNPEQLGKSRESIIEFIPEIVNKYRADAGQVYVAGFSQGAVMSYQVGLTAPGKVKGIGVLSGMIVPSLKPLIKNTTALKHLKVFISHGTADNRIPFADGKAADDYLRGLGLSPQFHQYSGMGHAISNDVLNDLIKWLQ